MVRLFQKGQHSNNVVGLQNAINMSLDDIAPLVLDGIFGPKTEKATRLMQKRFGLGVDGIIGPKTLGALYEKVSVKIQLIVAQNSRIRRKLPGEPGFGVGPEPVSFGAIGNYRPNLEVGGWLSQGFPKPPVPRKVYSPRINIRAFRNLGKQVHTLHVPEAPGTFGHSASHSHDLALEGEFTTSTKDFEEIEFEMEFKILQHKKYPIIKPGVSVSSSPTGGWEAKTKVSVVPVPKVESHFARFSFHIGPSLDADFTTPLFLGDVGEKRESKLQLNASVDAELTWNPIERFDSFELYLGAKYGVDVFAKFAKDKIEAGVSSPMFEFDGGIRVKFGPKH